MTRGENRLQPEAYNSSALPCLVKTPSFTRPVVFFPGDFRPHFHDSTSSQFLPAGQHKRLHIMPSDRFVESVKWRVIERGDTFLKPLGRAGSKADGHTLLTNQQPRCTVAYCVPRKVLCILQPGYYLAIKWACFLTEPLTMTWGFCDSPPFQAMYLFSIWRNLYAILQATAALDWWEVTHKSFMFCHKKHRPG